MDALLLSEAVASADELLEKYYRLPVAKALDPTNPTEYLVIVQRLTTALQKAAKGTEKAAMKAALDALDVDWPKLTAGQVAAAVKASNDAFKAVLVKKPPPSMEKVFTATGKGIVQGAKTGTGKQFGFKVQTKWNAQDQLIIEHAAKSQAHFIRDEYGKRADAQSSLARRIVARGLKEGLDRHAIAQDLHKELSAQGINRSRAYYTMIAGTFANRSRSYAALSAMGDGGYTRYQFDAVLDEVTTQQCRFMHGRVFEVKHALDLYAKTAAAEDPADVKAIMPWVGYGKNEQGEPALYVKGSGGTKTHLATVAQSAYGKQDETGAFNVKLDGKGLTALGVMMPPLHGNCRSTVVPYDSAPSTVAVRGPAPLVLTPSGEMPVPTGEVAPVAPPVPAEQSGFAFGAGGVGNKPIVLAEPPVPPPPPAGLPKKLSPSAAKAAALAELGELVANPAGIPGFLFNPMAAPSADIEEAFKDKQALLDQAIGALTQKKYVKWGELSSTADVVDEKKLKSLIQNGKLLDKEQVVIAKVGKDYWIVQGHEAALASKMLGIQGVKADYVNLDAFKKELQKKPPPAPSPPAPKKADPSVILGTKTAGAAGHGTKHPATGFYRGTDGVDRYVKVYDEAGQAHGEHLANQLYKALGLGAPESATWVHTDGKQAYASGILPGKTLGQVGLTKENARELFKGFAADVLMANWDVVGASKDNVLVGPDGRIHRIDNGSAFLFRAQGGKKPAGLLDAMTEWDGFFTAGTNRSYWEVAKQAGYADPHAFKDEVKKQIESILALHAHEGGWGGFVDKHAPGFAKADRDAVVGMLEARTAKLRDKLGELKKGPPGSEPYYAPAVGGVAPKAGLKPKDLPVVSNLPKGWGSSSPYGVLPSGEQHVAYTARIGRMTEDVSQASRDTIRSFTSMSSGTIRADEYNAAKSGHAPGAASDRITRAFAAAKPEPGTVYRGNHSWSEQDVLRYLQAGKDKAFGFGRDGTGATSSAAWHAGVSVREFMGGVDRDGAPTEPRDGSYKVLFVIRAKTAIPIEHMSAVRGETERLLSRDSRYRVLTAARWPGRKNVLVIEVEEI